MANPTPPDAPPRPTRDRLAAKGIDLTPAHPRSCACKGTGYVEVAQFSSGIERCVRAHPEAPAATTTPFDKRAADALRREVERLAAEMEGRVVVGRAWTEEQAIWCPVLLDCAARLRALLAAHPATAPGETPCRHPVAPSTIDGWRVCLDCGAEWRDDGQGWRKGKL